MAKKHEISRRDFLSVCGAGASGLMLAPAVVAGARMWAKELYLYVGTYTSNTKSAGIYMLVFDAETGETRFRYIIRGVADPSFLTLDKNRKNLFAVNELVEYEGAKSGSVSAFAVDHDTGNLTFLNKQPSLGGAPCHITVSDNGKFVLVANYVGGNVTVFPVGKDGNLGAAVAEVKHSGTGPNKERQEAPHAHSITLDRRNRFAFAADLGTDKVYIYAFDPASGKLTPNSAQEFFQSKPGAGPRHFAFHPNGRLAFVINELDSTLTSLEYDEKLGTLKEINTAPTIPADFKGVNSCADVQVSPNGKFVYGSNRGHDSIAVFAVDQASGKIDFRGTTPTGGNKPRNFSIEPNGKFLLAANQSSGNIVIFKIDQTTGMLQNTGNQIDVPAPVCLKFTQTS